MDLATLIGLVGAFGVIFASIFMGGSISTFINVPSLTVVFAGTFLVTMMKFSLGQFLGAAKVAAKAFMFKLATPQALIEKSVELAKAARQGGILALEEAQIDDEFMKNGVNMLIDGHQPDIVRDMLTKDMMLTLQRHEEG
ncbi:MAG: flagellar motor protein PomA, partial [Pseudomonadota bacterium]